MEIPQTFKDHPYAWGIGGFLLLVLLFYWLFKPSATAASTTDPNAAYYNAAALAAASGNQLSSDQLAANAAVNTAQIQAGVQGQAIGAAQAIAQTQATTGAATAQDYINSLLTLGMGQLSSQNYQTMATTGSNLALAGLATGTDTGNAIAASQSAALYTFDPTMTTAQANLSNSAFWRIFGFNPQTGPPTGSSFVNSPYGPTVGLPSDPSAIYPNGLGPTTPPPAMAPSGLQAANTNAATPIGKVTTIGSTLAA